jgi:hypothetical protein
MIWLAIHPLEPASSLCRRGFFSSMWKASFKVPLRLPSGASASTHFSSSAVYYFFFHDFIFLLSLNVSLDKTSKRKHLERVSRLPLPIFGFSRVIKVRIEMEFLSTTKVVHLRLTIFVCRRRLLSSVVICCHLLSSVYLFPLSS